MGVIRICFVIPVRDGILNFESKRCTVDFTLVVRNAHTLEFEADTLLRENGVSREVRGRVVERERMATPIAHRRIGLTARQRSGDSSEERG